jgi:alpha-tubulin suppressor-like RCC1 family protein
VNGELGNGAGATNNPMPALVTATAGNTSAWTEVAAGLNHTCAVRMDGTLWCWGRNAQGQLGDGTTTTRSDPKQVLPADTANWVDVATSGEFTCGLRSTGALFCWGRNDNAQLGLGNTTSPMTSPQQVGAATYKAIDVSANHTCAVATDGTLWCWGRNANGELGVGNSVGPVMTPVQIGTDKDWAKPYLGQGLSTCVSKQSGDLYCWGVGSFGQLGLSSLTSFNAPQKVPSVGAFTSVSLGNEHTCAVRDDGRLFCWGASYWAQLGGGLPFVSKPTLVLDPP